MKIIKKVILMIVNFFFKYLKIFFKLLGYNLSINFKKTIKNSNKDELNLNIGAGTYVIDGFTSLDRYSSHYYPNKNKFLKERVNYNLRKDNIPYKNNSVDNIYVSHVLEHVENEFVIKFIYEAYRVLKPSGVLRIVCPDAKFLFQVSQFSNDYWYWRKKGTFSNKKRTNTDWNSIEQYDYLLKELSSPNCRFYNYKVKNNLPENKELKKLDYEEFKNLIQKETKYREEFPNDHINIIDFDTIYKIGSNAKFSQIVNSKKNGSVSSRMQSIEFDKTAPQMSLYVDLIK